MGEEEAVLQMESSFKELFTKIYKECKQTIEACNNPKSKDLPHNPLFSAAYLARLLKQYMNTAPLWSNLLLGNFARRYNYSSDDIRLPCTCHFGRTTGVSESQMRILKETILHKKVHTRIDEVATVMGDTIEAIELQYADHIFMKKRQNHILPAKQNKPAGEGWNKRKRMKNATGLYTSDKPSVHLGAMYNTRLLGQNDNALLGKYFKNSIIIVITYDVHQFDVLFFSFVHFLYICDNSFHLFPNYL